MAIHIDNRWGKAPVSLAALRRDLTDVLHTLALEKRELSLVLVGDEEIRTLNRLYLERDRPTNVLSFPAGEDRGDPGHPLPLGDIVISVDTAARDAGETGIPLEDALLFLVIHGLLHLAGYDHERPGSDEEAMRKKENELFRRLRGYEME
ncbi:MAG TPA: rRNA maturation RNase YbeY [Syntrophales bacterium]|nr:rRNA maturation RNase YbeY [Syntrophales bacterium]